METATRRAALGIGLFSLALVGCASGRVNLVENGTVSVEKVDTSLHEISSVNVVQSGKHLILSGEVKRRPVEAQTTRPHIDVQITTPDGRLIEKVLPLEYSQKPKTARSRRRYRNWYPRDFHSKLPFEAPEGSKIRVEHHTGIHK